MHRQKAVTGYYATRRGGFTIQNRLNTKHTSEVQLIPRHRPHVKPCAACGMGLWFAGNLNPATVGK